jgi:hypothetical protein
VLRVRRSVREGRSSVEEGEDAPEGGKVVCQREMSLVRDKAGR